MAKSRDVAKTGAYSTFTAFAFILIDYNDDDFSTQEGNVTMICG